MILQITGQKGLVHQPGESLKGSYTAAHKFLLFWVFYYESLVFPWFGEIQKTKGFSEKRYSVWTCALRTRCNLGSHFVRGVEKGTSMKRCDLARVQDFQQKLPMEFYPPLQLQTVSSFPPSHHTDVDYPNYRRLCYISSSLKTFKNLQGFGKILKNIFRPCGEIGYYN